MTAAQKRAAEVDARRGPRAPRDPAVERQRIDERRLDEWIDEGDLRAEAANAATRALAQPRPRKRRPLAPETAARIGESVHDRRRGEVLAGRLADAQHALDRDRFDEARRIATGLLRELGNVAAVHEVIGLADYRMGRWRQAASALETASALEPNVELMPVLADVYRAQHRWADVERLWADIRAASPSHEVMAEARIVAAGAQADRGDLDGALATMARATEIPKRVHDHHLRQWYVLGDLNDRAGNTLEAARWFELVARHDPEFVDVRDRLRALGR